MSKINEILSEVMDSQLYTDDDIRACTLYSVRAEQVVECMKRYTGEVIEYILQHPEMIYIDEGNQGDYPSPEEAVYNYDAFEKLKKDLI